MEQLQLTTADGVRLDADLIVPDAPVALAVICHPHPAYGGDRHHPIVEAVFGLLGGADVATIRFDFRRGSGAASDGTSERADLVAAIDHLTDRFPDTPVVAVGYSFGASVVLGAADPRVVAQVAVAPPLPMLPVPAPTIPTLLLVPEHDQFCPPDDAARLTSGWSEVELHRIEMADHFLAGRADVVATSTRDWLRSRVGS